MIIYSMAAGAGHDVLMNSIMCNYVNKMFFLFFQILYFLGVQKAALV